MNPLVCGRGGGGEKLDGQARAAGKSLPGLPLREPGDTTP